MNSYMEKGINKNIRVDGKNKREWKLGGQEQRVLTTRQANNICILVQRFSDFSLPKMIEDPKELCLYGLQLSIFTALEIKTEKCLNYVLIYC